MINLLLILTNALDRQIHILNVYLDSILLIFINI